MAASRLLLAMAMMVLLRGSPVRAQTAPVSPDKAWHSEQEDAIRREARKISSIAVTAGSGTTYSLADLIDLAESHNPETRVAWEKARARGDALGVARSELFPTLVAVADSQTSRAEIYLNTRYYRQTFGTFDMAIELNYTIFDFGARGGRIDAAKAQLLASDLDFNDVHRELIYRVEISYYQLLNAVGQEAAARASLANAEAVREAAEESLKNGLATLPDVLEARSAAARANYDLQAALGAEDTAHGNLATALGASPLETIPVQSIDQIAAPDTVEVAVDQAIDRALQQRPDLLKQVAEIRSADARVKEAKAAFFPALHAHVSPDAQTLYANQQTLPWGHTASLNGGVSFSLDWTIADGGARKHTLAEAKDDVRAAEAQAAATRDEIENGVWTAYSDLKTALRQREAAAALLAAANQSYNAALESYHYGVRNFLDVTEAQRTLAQARSADVLARTQVLSALAALAFQTGDLIQPSNVRPQP